MMPLEIGREENLPSHKVTSILKFSARKPTINPTKNPTKKINSKGIGLKYALDLKKNRFRKTNYLPYQLFSELKKGYLNSIYCMT
jgi:hypothetical protein